MTVVTIGDYALSGAMLTAFALFLGMLVYSVLRDPGLLRAIRFGTGLLAALLTISCISLLTAMLQDNFAVDYVRRHSEEALPLGFKIAAFWAGQEGSLLLWAWMIAVMGVVLAWRLRKHETLLAGFAMGMMAAVTGMFTSVMMFAGNAENPSNPFLPSPEGLGVTGLNPILQNWMMVLHPPMLFIGYAAYTVPFALLLGHLWGKPFTSEKPELVKEEWLSEARIWMVFGWVTLTVGIVLGSGWAYMVLGWGGYWGWDPVENASLLPWLTGTALLHSAVMQATRGVFKRWTAFLTAASFFLCIFGTYLTRSGVVQSVHTFGDSPIGTFFLVVLWVIAIISLISIFIRLDLLKGARPMDEFLSREGMILAANVLLVVITLIVTAGTLWEKISLAFSDVRVTLSPAFYNKMVLPMALLLAAIMATGPVLGAGVGAFARVKKKLIAMVLVGLAAALAILLLHRAEVVEAWTVWHAGADGYKEITSSLVTRLVWIMAVAWTAAAVVTGIAIDVVVTIKSGQDIGVMRLMHARLRHWGAQFAHLGLAIMVIGIAGSLYVVKQDKTESLSFTVGGPTHRVGQYTLKLTGVEPAVRRENHVAYVTNIEVTQDGGETFMLRPERRIYDHGMRPGQSIGEVAIRFGVFEDVYLNFAGLDEESGAAVLEVFINPLVNWIWVGATLLTLGGIVCMVPRKREVAVPQEEPAPEETPEETLRAGGTARERRRAKLNGSPNLGKAVNT